MDDHVVRNQVEKERGLDRDREVTSVLVLVDPGQQIPALGAVRGEILDAFTELGPVPHEELGGQPVGKLR
ncbi:hypothetical protein GCM10025778_30630 [Paeniglutamicibacter antarcticus]|uniref:Uncharacterized protein n=1 Tax=Paeniglutamicibacter antarcticus TaxID=494023 RepID=A0ABP9TQQ0_9MICC